MLTIALLSAALASANATPVPFAPFLDQSAVAPNTAEEDAQKAIDVRAIEPSSRAEFLRLSALKFAQSPWVVRAQYQDQWQLNLLRRRAAPWRIYPDAKIVIIEINNLLEYDQLINEGFLVQIDAERTARLHQLPTSGGEVRSIPGFSCYRTVEETYTTAENLVASNPQIAEWLDIGDSRLKQLGQGGYDIRALHLTNRSIPGPKPVVLIQGAIHAREYATAESVTRFAEQMVQGYGVNPDITWMIDYNDINLILVANPDGRKLAETSATRMTRKNRNPAFVCAADTQQTGVDLNRNYPFDYGGPGTSTTICSQTFRGPSAISEAESLALTTFEQSIFPDQRAETSVVPPDQTTPVSLDASGIFIDVHSNGGGTWFPWGNTSAGVAPNATQLQSLARKLGFLNGLPGARSSDFGAIGGATDDWSFGTLGVAAFTMELGGNDFFPPCTTYEASIGPPAVASFFMAARTARAPYRLPAGPDVLNMAASYTPSSATITASANDTRFNPATEPTQNIASVALYTTTPWTPGATPIANFTASDGSFSSNIEGITVTLSGAQLPTNMKTLYYAQATDAAGNAGPVSAVFLSPQSLFRDGFE
jgi:carboxypeptidase T